MFITATNLAHYLIGRSLITSDSVVDGDFQVVEAGRRNRNFKVVRRKSPGLFVKQISSMNAESIATLGREAAFYGMLRARPDWAALARLVPRVIDFNPEVHALALELIPDGENLTEYHLRLGVYPEAVGTSIGQALGTYHSPGFAGVSLGGTDGAIFPRIVPWVLNIDPTTLMPLPQFGPAGEVLAAALRQCPAVVRNLALMRRAWSWHSLIHGDIKFDNFLVSGEPDGRPSLRIVDWEMVDLGDAAWDVASIISTYLAHWLLVRSAGAAAVSGGSDGAAIEDFGVVRPSLRAFWIAYSAARQWHPSVARLYLDHCIRFCAARLVATAFEYLYAVPQSAASALLLTRIGEGLLESPDVAVTQLFGS